jgi:glycosyltransferase involved in cell wall biosynthesis
MNLYIWQSIVSPHMAGLAIALARKGCKVTYVAENVMSEDRKNLGWSTPALPGIALEIVSSKIAVIDFVANCSRDSIHICQGLRSNGLLTIASIELSNRGLQQWVVMETIDDSGWLGFFKRLEYNRLFWVRRQKLKGVLANGYKTSDWIMARGMPKKHIFPFTYFLPPHKKYVHPKTGSRGFRIIFVGNLIERKRLDLLIHAISKLPFASVELVVIGDGPLYKFLRAQAEAFLPGRVDWLGCLPMDQVPNEIAKADCLVLPSRHDGWGVVVSESLMVGTQVICSDRCGAAGVVEASGYGGVFKSGDLDDLQLKLQHLLDKGPLPTKIRKKLSKWALCLSVETGADYLLEIITYANAGGIKPLAPWIK